MIVMSYREAFEHRCSRSCNCLLASGSSDFEIENIEPSTVEAIAEYIAKRINAQPESCFSNILIEHLRDLKAACNGYNSPCQYEDSIVLPYLCKDDYLDDAGDIDYDRYENDKERLYALHGAVKTLVKSKLTRRR